MSGGSIWSGSRRVMAAEVENPAASSPGGAPSGQITTGGIYSGANAGRANDAAENASTQYKVVIVGDSGVGKSCLLVRYTDDRYENQVSTVGVDFKTRDVTVGQGTRVRLQLWDTAGQERYRATMAAYYRGAQGIIFTYSVDDERTFKNIPRWIADVEKTAGPGCAKILIGNKADVDDKSERQVHYNEAQKLAIEHNLEVIETSALNGHNVEQAFQMMGEAIHRKLPDPAVYQGMGSSFAMQRDEGSTGTCC